MSALALDDLPFPTDVEGGPREIVVRHALEPFQVALLDRLGWTYRIDPDAERCERPCGNSRCARTAAELRQIAQLVDEETRRRNLPNVRERVDRGIERGMRIVRDPRDVSLERRPPQNEQTRREPVESADRNERTERLGSSDYRVADDEQGNPVLVEVACKIDGCDNRANAKYDRGPYARLCWETHVPAAREEASRRAIEVRQRSIRSTVFAPAPEPEPEPKPEPPERALERIPEQEPPALVGVPDPPPEKLDFVDLAFAMHEATDELVAARERYRRAREAIVAHPIFRDLYLAVENGAAIPAWEDDPDPELVDRELPAAR